MDEGKRSGQITLFNSGDKAVTYRIESIDLVPLEAGGYSTPEEGADVPEWSAAPLLRYAPRQVTLEGGQRQVVKIISRARRDTAAGEYRTHLRFSTIPLVEAVGEGEETSAEEKGKISVSVGLEYRITVPVILRIGDLENGVEIGTARYDAGEGDTGAHVVLELNRLGDVSDYSTIRILDVQDQEIGLLKEVAVLPPLHKRQVRVPLDSPSAQPAKIIVENGKKGAAKVILSEKQL